MVKASEFTNLVLRVVATKLEAMEEMDSGLLLKTRVTKVDRLALILDTVKSQYQRSLLATELTEENLEVARKVLDESDVSYGAEELALLAKLRRYVAKKVTSEGPPLHRELF